MKRFLFLAAIAVAGCSTTGEPTTAEQAVILPYVKCNVLYSKRFARQPGDAITLAKAAEIACTPERLKMEAVIGPFRTDNFRIKATEGNVADIAKARA